MRRFEILFHAFFLTLLLTFYVTRQKKKEKRLSQLRSSLIFRAPFAHRKRGAKKEDRAHRAAGEPDLRQRSAASEAFGILPKSRRVSVPF